MTQQPTEYCGYPESFAEHFANGNAKLKLRKEFRDKYITDDLIETEKQYLELSDLIAKEKRFSEPHTILLRKRSEATNMLSYYWNKEYHKQNPDRTIQEYVALRESMLLGILEETALGFKAGTANTL